MDLGRKAINAAGQSNLLIQKCPGSKVSSGPKSRFFRHTDIPTIYEKYYRTCIFRTKKTKTDFRSNIVMKIPNKIIFKICDTGTLMYRRSYAGFRVARADAVASRGLTAARAGSPAKL